MSTVLGETKTYKRLSMTFRDSIGKSVNLSLDNPKNIVSGDYADIAAQDAALDTAMATVITKNIFHNNNNDLSVALNAREVDYSSKDVKD